jgi:hypothetical protein
VALDSERRDAVEADRMRWASGAGACILLCGCQLTPTFTTGYWYDRAALRPAPVAGALAVRRFEEERPPRKYSTAGRIFLTYVPLLPYVTQPFERLEESVRMISEEIRVGGRGMTLGANPGVAPEYDGYVYTASMARAIAEDLGASGLFTEVVYVGDEPPGVRRFELRGALRESPIERYTTSYGLGMAGVLLWILPVPIGKTTSEVAVDLTLTDRNSGAVLWQHTLDGRVSALFTMYNRALVYGRAGGFSFQLHRPPGDAQVDRQSLFGWHFEALRRAMAAAKPDLARALEKVP